MSSHIHSASAFPQVQTYKNTTKTGSKTLSPVAKSGKACSTLDMNQLSPHVSKQAPPSPPTSTPTQAPPASPRKRKSVNFNDQPLRSARSIPKHRSRARTIATIPPTKNNTQHLAPVQPTLFSSRSYADQQKRARLSLAAPQPNFSTSPSATYNRDADLRRLQSNGSPLGAKAEARKKLSRFYYNSSFLQEVPHHPKSPTLATSAGSKQAGRRNSHPMLSEKDQPRLENSDLSSDSDEDVAMALINDPFDTRKTSCSRLQKLRDELNGEADEEIAELRPILKKTRGQILLAETVQQATAENGRRRLSLDPAPPLAYRRVIAAVTSKASRVINSSLPADASSSALPAEVTESSETNQSTGSLNNLPEASNTNIPNESTDDTAWPTDGSDSHSSEASNSINSDGIEACLLSSARSCLITLQASLLPPPNEMRLDPVSPLAKLTSPQKHKLSKLGTLDGSPREPRGVLPRAPTCNTRLVSPKTQPRARGRQRLRARPRSADSQSTSTTPSTSGPLRTPESSPLRHSATLPQVTITLREVEDAYISLHDHLDAFFKHWQDTGPPSDEDQQSRLEPLFADNVGASLMKCLVREVENLCRHDDVAPVQPQSTSSNQAAPDLRDEISRMIVHSTGKTLSTNDASVPSPAPVNKSGASTNEIRRRVAEIETGQAALRCIAILWSWPSCMIHFEDSYAQRLLSLLIQIPKSSVLRRKKNLVAIGLMNHIFKLQRLKGATLEPHVSCVVDAIASTLYLSAGKSGDKGQKVLCLGLSALQQLITQVPHHMTPKIGKFLEPFLASLMAPDSSMLRHHAIAGLGALINCTKQEWDVSAKSPPRVPIHDVRTSPDTLLKLQQGRKEAFKEKLSTFVLAFYNDKNTFLRWKLLAKQIKRSLKAGDVGWVISVMATMIALLGKRIRKLDPPLTQAFMPIINHLVRDSRTKHLTSQLWDYYIHVMLQWSVDHRTDNPEEFWALDPMQLTFFMQLFRGTYSVPANTVPSPQAAPSNASLNTTGISDQYQSLLQPNKDAAGTEPRTNPVVLDASLETTALPENAQSQPPDGAQSSSHHNLLSAYLYGAVGFIKKFLAHPPMYFSSPSELLAMTNSCSRFQYLDTVWDQMIEPFLPNILSGPNDEQRLHVYEVLAALCRHDTSDSPIENTWTLERLLHPAYHQPPTKPGSTTEICLEQFSNAALSSAVVPVEIPALDPLWICSRYDKVLPMIASSISSIQHIKNLKANQWVKHPSTGSHRAEDSKRVGPRSMFRLWQELMKSIGSVYQTCDWIFDTELSASLSAIGDTLEKAIQVPAPLALRNEREPHHSPNISIFLFRHLYCILKHGLGPEIMNRRLIEIDASGSHDETRKISLSSKILSFFFTSSSASEIANTLDPEDWVEYGALAQVIVDDFISAQKAAGFNEKLYDLVNDLSEVLQACTQDQLISLFGKISMKTVIELMEIVEPGVLLDEPLLKPASALMIHACFKSMQDGGDVDQNTRKKFIEVFNEFISRLTEGSLKIMLDSCQTSFSAYLNDERNDDRQLLYNTLLSKFQNVDLALLMPPVKLAALILSPFQNQSSSSTFSPAEFLQFVTTPAHAYIGEQQDIVQAVKDLSPVTPLEVFDNPLSSSSSMTPPDDTESTSPILEKESRMHNPNSVQKSATDHASIPTELCNSRNESQSSPSAQETSKEEAARESSSESLDKSNAEMITKATSQEHSHTIPVEYSAGSPAQDSPASEQRNAESADVYDNVIIEQSQTLELRLQDKSTDSVTLPRTTITEPVDVLTGRPHAKLIEKSGASPLSQATSPKMPSEIYTDEECSFQQLDPRLFSEPLHKAASFPPQPSERSLAFSAHPTKTSAITSLQFNYLTTRDPALFGPLQSQRSSDSGDVASPRLLQASIQDTGPSSSHSSGLDTIFSGSITYVAGAPGQVDGCIDPDITDSKTPLIRFDEISMPFFQLSKQLSIDQPGLFAPTRRLELPLNAKNINSATRLMKSSAISSPSSSSIQPFTPKSFLHPAEAHDHRISPITTSLGALDTLAPFAKRQAGKFPSPGLPQLASLEPARSAREMLQNMTTRKPQENSKTEVQAGSSAGPSSQNIGASPDAPDVSSKPALLSKRKRDEPYSNLADNLDHPSQATSTFAAADLVSRSQSVASDTRAASAALGDLLSPSSSTRKLSQISSTRKSPVRHLLPSLSSSAPNDNSNSHSPPPRKKTKCSESSVIPPIEGSDEASNVSKKAVGSLPSIVHSQPDEVHSQDTSAATLNSPKSDSPRPLKERRGNRRGCEIQQLFQDVRQSEILLESASSSQLGRITKTASDILVSRARVTRSSSRRLSSVERLSN